MRNVCKRVLMSGAVIGLCTAMIPSSVEAREGADIFAKERF